MNNQRTSPAPARRDPSAKTASAPARLGAPTIPSRTSNSSLLQAKPAAAAPPVYRPGEKTSRQPRTPAIRSAGSGPPSVYRPNQTQLQPKTQTGSRWFSRAIRLPVTFSSVPGRRASMAVVQRLALPQAGRTIAEDNQTLKEEYFKARDEGRNEDRELISRLQNEQARAWKESEDNIGAISVVSAETIAHWLDRAPVVEAPELFGWPTSVAVRPVTAQPGIVKMGVLNKPPFQGGTPGQRYIRWGNGEYPHTSITFKILGMGEEAEMTGLHASIGKSDTHFWWNHRSAPGTFHLSSQGGAKWGEKEVAGFTVSGRRSLAKAWAKVAKHAKKVNSEAVKPPGID
jgi:hypothetical protein